METQRRTLVKTVTYRTAAILATIPFTGVVSAISIHVVLALIYYVHERFLDKSAVGKILMGLSWLRLGYDYLWEATRKVTDVIGAKIVTANDSYFAMAA